jgi:hypothetical protein
MSASYLDCAGKFPSVVTSTFALVTGNSGIDAFWEYSGLLYLQNPIRPLLYLLVGIGTISVL